jgi:hypothetical protein
MEPLAIGWFLGLDKWWRTESAGLFLVTWGSKILHAEELIDAPTALLV